MLGVTLNSQLGLMLGVTLNSQLGLMLGVTLNSQLGLVLGWVFFETKAYPISKGPVHGHGGFWFHNQRNTSMFLTSKAF